MLLFQDQAGGALLEDVPSGVYRPGEEGKSGLSGRTHSDGGLQTGSAGGCGADAAGTRMRLCGRAEKGSPQGW